MDQCRVVPNTAARTADLPSELRVKALVFTAAGRVELRDEPAPVPASDEVLITVEASGICGSELHGFRSVGFRRPPMIMGHEFAGTLPDGTPVVVNPLISCGNCAACRDGRAQLCESRELPGGEHVQVAGRYGDLFRDPRRMFEDAAERVNERVGACSVELGQR